MTHDFNFTTIEYQDYFNKTDNKVFSNVDTFYYSVFVNPEDYADYFSLIAYLDDKKRDLDTISNLDHYDLVDGFQLTKKSFFSYGLCIERPGKYAVFLSRKIVPDVPQMIVMLWSEYLWLNGIDKCFENSVEELSNFLATYHINFLYCQENRIDICHHTNSVNNLKDFFINNILGDTLVTRLKRYSIEGNLNNSDFGVDVDYISIGRRKSNNIFVRIYNKVQEVINLKHKYFFLDIWQEQGLISKYDYIVYSDAFKSGDYNDVARARLKFYVSYGKNPDKCQQAIKLLKDNNAKLADIKILADELTPQPTLVVNFEFQIMRKFTAKMEFDTFDLSTTSPLFRVKQIIKSLGDLNYFITTKTLRFVDKSTAYDLDKCDILDFWQSIINSVPYQNLLKRNYENNFDLKNLKIKVIRSLASLSSLKEVKNNVSGSYDYEIQNLLVTMNENDFFEFEKYKNKYLDKYKSLYPTSKFVLV